VDIAAKEAERVEGECPEVKADDTSDPCKAILDALTNKKG